MSFRRFISLFSKWQVQLSVLLIHIFLGIIGLYSFIFNYQLTENYLIQNTEDEEVIIAQAGARSIENFFNNVSNQLSSLVFSFEKVREDTPIDKDNTRKEFARYINQAKTPVSGIAFYDESGKLSIIENVQKITTGENEDFSDEDFIKWSRDPQNRDKTFITHPFISRSGASKGKVIMAIATPLYFGNHYKGTLAIRFLVSRFKDAFISPLTSDGDEDTTIIDSNGILIAGDDKLINKNLIDYAKETRWNKYEDFIYKFKSVIQKKQSKTAWTFKFPDSPKRDYLISSSRIDIPNTDNDLYLIISTPQDKSIKLLTPIRSYGSIWAGLGILFTLLGGVIYVVIRR